MSNELKTLPSGEVVLRNEEDWAPWFREKTQSRNMRISHPDSYPCLAQVRQMDRITDEPVYTYLSDCEAMVAALKAGTEPEVAFCLEATGGPELFIAGRTLPEWQAIQDTARDEDGCQQE